MKTYDINTQIKSVKIKGLFHQGHEILNWNLKVYRNQLLKTRVTAFQAKQTGVQKAWSERTVVHKMNRKIGLARVQEPKE